MDHDRDTLGKQLKRHRESLLIPLQEIAQALNVKKDLLEALERDDYTVLAPHAHVLTLVKQIAAHLKLNGPEVVQRFEHQWRLHEAARAFPKLSSFADSEAPFGTSSPRGKGKKGWGWQLPPFPSPQRLKLSGVRFRLSTLAAILVMGLVFIIDLPLSTQKPPAADPRFAKADRKTLPPTSWDSQTVTAPTEAVKTEDIPRELPPPRQKAARLAVSAEKIPPAAKNGRIVGNSDTKRYHLPGMKFYDKVRAHHRVSFPSEKEAVRAGYRKAKE